MKKILSYILIGVVSAGTTYGLIEYNNHKRANRDEIHGLVSEANEDNNSSFASYNYTSSGTVMPDFTQAAAKSVNAVVSIKNYGDGRMSRGRGQNPFDFFNDPFFDQFFKRPEGGNQQEDNVERPTSAGSGVIISEEGYIVTNNHVIEGANRLEITLNNGENYTASVVGTDPNTDIALIKIDVNNLPFLSFQNSDNVKVVEWVLAVGNPFGLNSTVTAGIVSAKGRSIDILSRNGDHPIESFIQTDAAINPGNSGGALVDTNGNLVGINTAIYSQTGSYAGYGFAVPSNLVKKIVNDIKSYGRVQRGYLGVSVLDLSNESQVRMYNQEMDKDISVGKGVMISGLQEQGGAEQAGLKEGDIIEDIDGKPVKSFGNLSALVGSKNPGDKVNVTVNRKGQVKTYAVTLKDLQGSTKIRSVQDLTPTEKLGASFEPLTQNQKVQYGIKHGVVVTDVSRSGKLANIGLQRGYIITKINDKNIDSVKDIENELKNHKGNVSINFVDHYGRIYTQGFTMD